MFDIPFPNNVEPEIKFFYPCSEYTRTEHWFSGHFVFIICIFKYIHTFQLTLLIISIIITHLTRSKFRKSETNQYNFNFFLGSKLRNIETSLQNYREVSTKTTEFSRYWPNFDGWFNHFIGFIYPIWSKLCFRQIRGRTLRGPHL